jgi:hypothetical protein
VVQDDQNVEDLATAVAVLRSNAVELQDVVDDIRSHLHQYCNDINDIGNKVRSLVQAFQSSVPGDRKKRGVPIYFRGTDLPKEKRFPLHLRPIPKRTWTMLRGNDDDEA